MAIGDAATAKGYPLVPDVGTEGLVKWGAREINRTRDLVAGVKDAIPASPAAFRTAAGITSGTAAPNNANGANGDIYFKIQ